ncbi:MAG: hypothetical protein ACRC7D_22475 [Aeromonas popoffii]|uniref:hypothetical protein n=1 Tax=Aeromonas popoffii TaxID=70856 RepID=UPI003F392D00
MVAFTFSDDEMMTMTFTIPEWLIWVVGVPVGIAALGAAAIGVAFIISFGSAKR